MHLHTSDDLAIFQRVLDRRPEALAELYDRYAPLLLAVARRILSSPGEAEEALRETFLHVWNQADRYDKGRSSISTWLVLIARDKALDRRRHQRAEEYAGAAGGPEGTGGTGGARNGSTAEVGLETLPGVYVEGASVKERRLRVQKVLAQLPAEHKEILELAFFEDLSLTEVAERVRAPLATVRSRALSAMKQLRRELRAEIRELM